MFDHIRAYHRPRSIPEAVRLLQKGAGAACVLAGGTDLVLRAGRTVTTLVDISGLDLAYLKRDAQGMRIGAMTTMAALEQSSAVQHLAGGILARAAAACGNLQTRNVATIGGNLANASPAADAAVALLALDAEVVLLGLRRKRRLPLGKFFSGPHETAANGSLLTEIVIPPCMPHTAFSFQRLSRTESDIAIVNVAAGIQLDRGRCAWARIALGAVAPLPLRSQTAEIVLSGNVISQELIEQAAEAAANEVRPISDLRASAEYRQEMSRVLVKRALQECAKNLERGR